MSRNDITGDSISTKPANDKFRSGYDRIWGKEPAPAEDRISASPAEPAFQDDDAASGEIDDKKENL